jgi:hypothetical protein
MHVLAKVSSHISQRETRRYVTLQILALQKGLLPTLAAFEGLGVMYPKFS